MTRRWSELMDSEYHFLQCRNVFRKHLGFQPIFRIEPAGPPRPGFPNTILSYNTEQYLYQNRAIHFADLKLIRCGTTKTVLVFLL